MSLPKKLKTALDETRLLIMGSQILFGFEFNAIFQEGFEDLSPLAHALTCLAILLMAASVGLLIAPTMQHRIVEDGQDSWRVLDATTRLAAWALLPFAISLGLDLRISLEPPLGATWASWCGIAFFVLALTFWYLLELLTRYRRKEIHMRKRDKEAATPLTAKIEQMLTEARVILPGAQALLGFDLVVTLTRSFAELPTSSKLIHVAALLLVALTVILLMAPAAFHRLAFEGEDSERFFRIGSAFVTGAPAPLGLGMSLDIYVAVGKASETSALGITAAGVTFLLLGAIWYVQPLLLRSRRA